VFCRVLLCANARWMPFRDDRSPLFGARRRGRSPEDDDEEGSVRRRERARSSSRVASAFPSPLFLLLFLLLLLLLLSTFFYFFFCGFGQIYPFFLEARNAARTEYTRSRIEEEEEEDVRVERERDAHRSHEKALSTFFCIRSRETKRHSKTHAH
jgi:hypothetical protein